MGQNDDAALVPGILHKCVKSEDGRDQNTKIKNLVVSAMEWPNQGKDDGSAQAGSAVGVGMIIGSTTNCEKLTCPEGEFVNENAGYAGECQPCLPERDGEVLQRCRSSEFMSGKCEGSVNTLKCEPCNAPGSEDEYCPADAWLQYRSGACGGGTTNGFKCLAQPNCSEGTNLKYYDDDRKGRCETCAKSECRSNQYRKGSCSGITNGYSCESCNRLTCSAKFGAEEYVDGQCGGTANTLQCRPCDNVVCGEHEYRSGKECNDNGAGFRCKVQPVCSPGILPSHRTHHSCAWQGQVRRMPEWYVPTERRARTKLYPARRALR